MLSKNQKPTLLRMIMLSMLVAIGEMCIRDRVMTGISADGQVTGVKLTSQDETPGLGQKALDASFTDQYKMEIPENGFAVTKDSPSGEITAIAGATITSRAVTNSVNEAITIYDAVTGGGN